MKDSWEGIENNTLRVFVYYEEPDYYNGRINPEIKELIQNSGRSRAEMLLLSFMRTHVAGIDRTIACQQMIPDIIAKGRLRHMRCDYRYCSAYFDFDVRDFLDAAGFGIPDKKK